MENCNAVGMEALRAAVVTQACYDYLSFLKHPGRRIHYDTKKGVRKYETERTLSRWFRSKDFTRDWCSVSGERIMEQLRENHKNGIRLYTDEMLGV